jgi:predicted PurR-regulated permease PerM
MNTPKSWSLVTRLIIIGVSLLVVGLTLYTAWPMLGPLSLALLLAYTLNPLVIAAQERFRLQRKWAVTLVYFIFLLLLIAIPGTLAPILIRQVRSFSEELVDVETELTEILSGPLVIWGQEIYFDQLWTDLLSISAESLTPAAENALRVIETTSVSLAWLLVILVATYYLLRDGKGLRDWLISLAPDFEREGLHKLSLEVDLIWRAYLQGTLTIMLIMAVTATIVGVLVGLPGAVAIGVLTGLFTIIPELGILLAGVLATLVAYFQGSNLLPLPDAGFAILVAILYLVMWQVKSNWLRPYVMGPTLRLNTGLVFVVIVTTVVLQGLLTALIILPVLATAGVIGRYIRCRLLDIDPWPDDKLPSLAQGLIQEKKEKPPRRKLRLRRSKDNS